MTEFAAAFNNTDKKEWVERGNMAVMCAMLHDLRKSVEHYRNWLNKQGAGQANVHAAEEPLPRPDTAKNYSIVEVLPLGQPPTLGHCRCWTAR